MDKKNIIGIQQIGVGVEDFQTAFNWYVKHFGMDIKIFEEAAVAELMLEYTEGKARERKASLNLNMQGGGGFEVWQHTGKKPELPKFDIKIGDIGIFSAKLKTENAQKAHEYFKNIESVKSVSEISTDPHNRKHFFVTDTFNNVFQFVETGEYFINDNKVNAGVLGAIISVSDIDKSLEVYQDILEYDKVVFDETSEFEDLKSLKGGTRKFRRVLLQHSKKREGRFADFFKKTEIELVQLIDEEPRSIYKDRIWGDPGFIHLCFDIVGMEKLKKETESKNYPFTVDSSESFDMGEAAGHFSYISDPDGIPIEFVETHKVPLLKKLGIYLNLRNKPATKPIPTWILKSLKIKRVK